MLSTLYWAFVEYIFFFTIIVFIRYCTHNMVHKCMQKFWICFDSALRFLKMHWVLQDKLFFTTITIFWKLLKIADFAETSVHRHCYFFNSVSILLVRKFYITWHIQLSEDVLCKKYSRKKSFCIYFMFSDFLEKQGAKLTRRRQTDALIADLIESEKIGLYR